MEYKTLRWQKISFEKEMAINLSERPTETNSRQQEASVVSSASVSTETDTNFICLVPNFACLERLLFQLKQTSISINVFS